MTNFTMTHSLLTKGQVLAQSQNSTPITRVTLCHQGFISPWKLTGHTYRTLGQFYSPCLVSFDSVFTLLAINMYLWLAPFVIGTTAEASHGAHIKAMTPTYTQSLRSHAISQRFFRQSADCYKIGTRVYLLTITFCTI